MDMVAFSFALERIVRRPVNDKTGLDGAFDFDLTYMPETLDAPVGSGGASGAVGGPPAGGLPPGGPFSQGGSSLFETLRNQLGLRLEGGRAPVDVLVVDNAQPPTEN